MRTSNPTAKKVGRLRVEQLEDRTTPVANVHTWIGLSSPFTPNWSDAGNWNGGVPTTGESGGTVVVFNTAVPNTVQDITGLVVDQLRFDPGASVTLTLGTTLGVNGAYTGGPNVTDTSTAINTSNVITAAGPGLASLDLVNATVTIMTDPGFATALSINAPITGAVGLTKTGQGTLVFRGANSFTGTTTVADGNLTLNGTGNTASNTVVVGDDVAGSGTAFLDIADTAPGSQIPDDAAVSVLGDGSFRLSVSVNEVIGSLTLGSATGGGNVFLSNGSQLRMTTPTLTVNAAPTESQITGTGKFVLGTTTTFDVADGAANPDLRMSAGITQSTESAGLVKSGAGSLLIENINSYLGTTALTQGVTAVNSPSTSSPFTMSDGAVLSGSGQLGTLTAGGGKLSPGFFNGVIQNLRIVTATLGGGTYSPLVDFGSISADLLTVSTVTLSGADLAPIAIGGGTIPTGTTFIIVSNDGTQDPVIGTFNGIAEGDSITFNGQTFIVSYVGGDGNDVTLKAFNGVVVSPATLPDGTVGTAYNQAVSASGGSGPPFTFAVTTGTLPIGLSLNANTGAITGTPTFSSTYNFTITATDSVGATGRQSYTVVINPAGTVTVNPPTLPSGTVGVPYNQTITATGGTGPYTFSVSGSLPPGLSLSSSGALTGTPTTAGSSTFSIIARESLGAVGFRTYTITIGAGTTITLSPAVLPGGTVGTPYSQTITATGGSPPYTFTVASGTLPAGLTLSSAGVLFGTPTTAGFTTFTVHATDGFGTVGSRDYFLSINSMPVIHDVTVSPPTLPNGTVGTAYVAAFAATGGGTAPYTFTLFGNLPAGLTLSSAGVITGTPTATGTSSFAVIATDQTRTHVGSRDYTITVTAAPVTITLSPPTLPGGAVGRAYSVVLMATGGTGPYSFAVSAGTLPVGLTLSTAGFIAGTPTAAGTSAFSVTATDSHGNAGSRNYSILVAGVAQPVHLTAIGSGAGGGPRVQVFNPDGSVRFDFFAFEESFYGGVRVAVGDVNGDGIDDIVTGAGFTGGPVVRVFSGADLTVLSEFFAYDENFRVGVFVAVGDINGDGFADVITGAGSALPGMAGGPHVEAFDGATIGTLIGPDQRPLALLSFFAYAEDFIGGVRVAAGDLDGDGAAEVVTAPGPGGGPEIKVYSYAGSQNPRLRTSFPGFDADYQAGLFVAVVPATADSPGGVFVGPDSFPDYAGTVFETLFPSLSTDAQLIRPAQVYAVSLPTADGAFFPTTAQRVPLFDISSLPNTGTRVGTAVASGTDLGAAKLLVGSGPGGGGKVQVYSVQDQAIVLEREFAAFDFDKLADPSSSPSVYVAGGLFLLPEDEAMTF